MNHLKLIAIRPLKDCNANIKRVLTEGQTYVFYRQYDFSDYNDEKRIMTIHPNEVNDLYSFKDINDHPIRVSIAGLVGQNGSGKSSIAELFYGLCYNLSVIKGILRDEDTGIVLGPKDRIPQLNVELFYEQGGKRLAIRLINENISVFEWKDNIFQPTGIDFDFPQFFYTIAINYSLHSLNEKVLGIWVKMLFHKNDGYQTPVVINPYREDGIIEINNEEYLIKSRLIANVLGRVNNRRPIEQSLRNIIDGKIAYRLHVDLNKGKFSFDDKGKPVFERTQEHGGMILPKVYKIFLNDEKFQPKQTLLNRYAQEYIIYKLFNIARKYEPYRSRFQFSFYESEGQLEAYLFMLKTEGSHVTFKLQQAVNFLKNELYIRRGTSFKLTVDYLSKKLNEYAGKSAKDLIEILPPPFFKTDIEFKDTGLFESLSSGEKQRVYSIATLIYHLGNLNSTNKKIVLYKYEDVNIIFDELELYFHPDLQRTLINDILVNFKKLALKNIRSINMLFITHSPFILSDIPSENILVLNKNGLPDHAGFDQQTFGANLFDLLKHKFFLEKGPIGEVARERIQETIDWLNDKDRDIQKKTLHRKLIALIGEPVLQRKLAQMYDSVTKEDSERAVLEKRLVALQKEIHILNNKP